jgi:hypothetical protein
MKNLLSAPDLDPINGRFSFAANWVGKKFSAAHSAADAGE